MANFLFRLWMHEAEDGLLPEVVVTADNRLQGAALALRHFVNIGRPIAANSYLECEPHDGQGLRVADVLRYLNARGVTLFHHADGHTADTEQAAIADFEAAEHQTLASLRL